MGNKLIKSGEEKFGLTLIANGRIHDNSKFHGTEWLYLNDEIAEVSPDLFQMAVQQHVTTNPHHPEYWSNGVDEMPRIYIAEMVADWGARSQEFGNDLREWIKQNAYERFSIPPTGKVAKQIKFFLSLLLEPAFKNVQSTDK